jgi:peroxiredoxin family protein
MSRETTFLVVSSDPEMLWRAALWALTAASVDETVRVWLTAPALLALGESPVRAEGSEATGLPDVFGLLKEARALGARVLTCETELALAGLEPDEVEGLVDAIEPLPSFWRGAAGGERLVM